MGLDFLGYTVFANQPTDHSGRVIWERVFDCGFWRQWQMTCGIQQTCNTEMLSNIVLIVLNVT